MAVGQYLGISAVCKTGLFFSVATIRKKMFYNSFLVNTLEYGPGQRVHREGLSCQW